MITTPEITTSVSRPAAVIRVRAARAELRGAVGPAIRELLTTLATQGVAPAGPWFTRHLLPPGEVLDCEIGIPVPGAITPAGRVRNGELPATMVVRAVHEGPHDELGRAWSELREWMRSRGLSPRQDLWESYVTGPEVTLDRARWRTELNQPVADGTAVAPDGVMTDA